jgi:hypothetical protein
VANADPKQMVHAIDHMPKKVANQITAAAKVSNAAFIHILISRYFFRYLYYGYKAYNYKM